MKALGIRLSKRNEHSFKRLLDVATRWCEVSDLACLSGSKERLREVRRGVSLRGGKAEKGSSEGGGSGGRGCLYIETLGAHPPYLIQRPLLPCPQDHSAFFASHLLLLNCASKVPSEVNFVFGSSYTKHLPYSAPHFSFRHNTHLSP